jgi:hypothetical protein
MGPQRRELVTFSHRKGCPVELRDLRYLRMSFVRFDGSPALGVMIVHRDSAEAVVRVFRRLYSVRWPIAKMRLVDDYRGNDELSMAANNTSGYNCRRVAGTDRWSDHAYGRAIDINPVQNPYILSSGTVLPPNGARYVDTTRTHAGRILAGHPAVEAFERRGWTWGGHWSMPIDYQHFEKP